MVKTGDMVTVKLMEIDERTGKCASRKALMEKPEGYVEPERRPRPPGGNPAGHPRSGDRDRNKPYGRGGGNNRR